MSALSEQPLLPVAVTEYVCCPGWSGVMLRAALVELSSHTQDSKSPVAVKVAVAPWQSDSGPLMLTLGFVLMVTVPVSLAVPQLLLLLTEMMKVPSVVGVPVTVPELLFKLNCKPLERLAGP